MKAQFFKTQKNIYKSRHSNKYLYEIQNRIQQIKITSYRKYNCRYLIRMSKGKK